MIEIGSLITIVGVISGVIFGYLGYRKGIEKDYKSEGKDHGTLKSDLSYIKNRTDDVFLEQKETNRKISEMNERITRVEESTKSAHKRIDDVVEDFKECQGRNKQC